MVTNNQIPSQNIPGPQAAHSTRANQSAQSTRANQAGSYRPQNRPTVIRDEHVLVSLGMAPLRATQRAYRHLSSIKGFGIVASIMTCYCAALSTEAIFIATPSALRQSDYTAEVRRSRRFVPKPYVNDGAELGRLNPLPTIQRAVLQRYFAWLPFWIKGNISSPYWTVWEEPGILALAVVGAVTIQRFEGLIWRKKSVQTTLQEFNEVNRIKRVEADPQAIAVAQYKAAEHNAQGTGGLIGTFVAVVLLYGLEIGAFMGSFAGAGNWAINTIYAFLTICGFETFDRLSDDAEEL